MSELGVKPAKRRGRGARRVDRTSTVLRFLPETDRGIPYVDLLSPEQVERVHRETAKLLPREGDRVSGRRVRQSVERGRRRCSGASGAD